MSKVTTKYQVTMPKRIADTYSIRPGDGIDWVAAGDSIRVIPPGTRLSAPGGDGACVKMSDSGDRAGAARIFTVVKTLIDTDILVYRYDEV